jgi:hypothetical protein
MTAAGYKKVTHNRCLWNALLAFEYFHLLDLRALREDTPTKFIGMGNRSLESDDELTESLL